MRIEEHTAKTPPPASGVLALLSGPLRGPGRGAPSHRRPRLALLTALAAAFLLVPAAAASAGTVTVFLDGTGEGTVTSSGSATPAEEPINCTNVGNPGGEGEGNCEEQFSGGFADTAELTATPAPGYAFLGWSELTGTAAVEEPFGCGPAPSLDNPCTFFIQANSTLTAVFGVAVTPPEVTIDSVEAGDFSFPEGAFPDVAFHGSVDPNNQDGLTPDGCTFQYVTEAQHAIDGYASAKTVPCDPMPTDEDDPVEVSATATGLTPDTDYRVRLRATKGGIAPVTAETTFHAPAVPPLIADQKAWQLSENSATLLATVNPANNEVAACQFQYVTQAQFEADGFASAEMVPCDPAAAEIGAGTSPVQVHAELEGLLPDTAYRARLIASNGVEEAPGDATVEGPDRPFATYPPVSFPARGFELVSAFDTNGYSATVPDSVSPDGAHFAYNTELPAAGAEAGIVANFRASRNPDGTWSQTYMGSPPPPPGQLPRDLSLRPLYSADLSRAALEIATNMDPDDRNEMRDAYLRSAGQPGGRWLSRDPSIPAGTPHLLGTSGGVPAHISPDGRRVLFTSSGELLGAGSDSPAQLFEWEEGEGLSLISAKPGTAAGFSGLAALGSNTAPETEIGRLSTVNRNAVSPDGARVAFQSGDVSGSSDSPSKVREHSRLFVRLTEVGETVEASAPAPGAPALTETCTPFSSSVGPCDVNYWGADVDTEQIFFTSTSQLTPDLEEGEGPVNGSDSFYGNEDSADLYRYDVASGELVDLTPHPGGAGVRYVLRVSDDARRVYFISSAPLAPGAPEAPGCTSPFSVCNLYLATLAGPADAEPEITHIITARLRYGKTAGLGMRQWGRQIGASPSGRYLAFLSSEPLVPGRETGEASGSGDLTEGSTLVTDLRMGSGAFAPSSRISGAGLADGTCVPGDPCTAVESVDGAAGTLELSRPATATVDDAALSSGGFAQAYLYDAAGDTLACASCPPDASGPHSAASLSSTGQNERLLGDEQLDEPGIDDSNNSFRNNDRPGPPRVTPSGEVFFETRSALRSADANGGADIYGYRAGRHELISSGRAPEKAFIGGAAADGSAVFFHTRDSLVPGVGADIIRVYAAVVGGGAPPLPLPDPPCTGEDCKPVATPQPNYAAPSTSTVEGRGNVVERPKAKRCRKGKVRRKGRCVKPHTKRTKRANHNRRAAR